MFDTGQLLMDQCLHMAAANVKDNTKKLLEILKEKTIQEEFWAKPAKNVDLTLSWCIKAGAAPNNSG